MEENAAEKQAKYLFHLIEKKNPRKAIEFIEAIELTQGLPPSGDSSGETMKKLFMQNNKKTDETLLSYLLSVFYYDFPYDDYYGKMEDYYKLIGLLIRLDNENIMVGKPNRNSKLTPLIWTCQLLARRTDQALLATPLVIELLSRGESCNPSMRDNAFRTTALIAACSGNIENPQLNGIISQLIDMVDPMSISLPDRNAKTALINACQNNISIENVMKLIGTGHANVDQIDEHGVTALMYLCDKAQIGPFEHAISTLIDISSPESIAAVDVGSNTALTFACENNKMPSELIMKLINTGHANVDQIDEHGVTALMHLCKKTQIRPFLSAISTLIDISSPESIAAVDVGSNTVLTLACENNKMPSELIMKLINTGHCNIFHVKIDEDDDEDDNENALDIFLRVRIFRHYNTLRKHVSSERLDCLILFLRFFYKNSRYDLFPGYAERICSCQELLELLQPKLGTDFIIEICQSSSLPVYAEAAFAGPSLADRPSDAFLPVLDVEPADAVKRRRVSGKFLRSPTPDPGNERATPGVSVEVVNPGKVVRNLRSLEIPDARNVTRPITAAMGSAEESAISPDEDEGGAAMSAFNADIRKTQPLAPTDNTQALGQIWRHPNGVPFNPFDPRQEQGREPGDQPDVIDNDDDENPVYPYGFGGRRKTRRNTKTRAKKQTKRVKKRVRKSAKHNRKTSKK